MCASTLSLFLTFGAYQKAEPWMVDFMQDVRKKVYVAFVGGSDLHKIKEQLGDDCMCFFLKVSDFILRSGVEHFDYSFSQNGLHALKDGKFLAENVRSFFS
jgi:phosphomannomutase